MHIPKRDPCSGNSHVSPEVAKLSLASGTDPGDCPEGGGTQKRKQDLVASEDARDDEVDTDPEDLEGSEPGTQDPVGAAKIARTWPQTSAMCEGRRAQDSP